MSTPNPFSGNYGFGAPSTASQGEAGIFSSGLASNFGNQGMGMSGAFGVAGGAIQGAAGLTQMGLGIAQAFDDPGYEAGILPQEFQIGLIRMVNDQLNYINKSIQTNQDLYKTYDQRIKLADAWMKNTIPSATATKALTATSVNLAQLIGVNSKDLAKHGFIGENEQKLIDQAKEQAAGSYVNPILEQQHKEQKRQLQQQLQRDGIPAAQQAIALQQFDHSAQEQQFQQSQMQSNSTLGILQSQLSTKMQGFNQAVGGLNAAQGQIGFGQQNQMNSLGLANQRYNLGQQNLQSTAGLYNTGQQAYQGFSQFGMSDETRALVQAGVLGPGTGYSQTGVPLQNAGDVADRVAGQNINTYRPQLASMDQQAPGKAQPWMKRLQEATSSSPEQYTPKRFARYT